MFCARVVDNAKPHQNGEMTTMDAFTSMRRTMVDCQLRTYDVTDPRVLAAAGRISREVFVPESRRDIAYIDQPVLIADGSPTSAPRYLLAPMVVARMLQILEIDPGTHFLDYAGGTGYTAALAADLGASVTLCEKDPDLAARAAVALAQVGTSCEIVSIMPATTFDAVLVNGSCEVSPTSLFPLLKIDGRLAVIEGQGRSARVILYKRYGDGLSGRPVFDAAAPALDEFRAPKQFAF